MHPLRPLLFTLVYKEWCIALLFSNNKNIQGDSGGKVSILRGNYFGHYEEKGSYDNVLNCELYLSWSCLNLVRTVLRCPLDYCLCVGMKMGLCKWKWDPMVQILNAFARMKIHEVQLRPSTRDPRSRVAKCTEVDSGICGPLLWNVTDLSFLCNTFIIEILTFRNLASHI